MSFLRDLVADRMSNRLFRAMRVAQISDRGPFREISLTSEAPLVLTGRSTTVAAIRGALRAAGHAQRTSRVKTYWDPRRTGLD
jgi:hypothetical protein